MFEDYLDDELVNEEEVYFDPNEDMESYYEFDLLDILEDIDIKTQDLSRNELETLFSKVGK